MRIGRVRHFIWLLLAFLCAFSFSLNLIVIVYDQVGDVYDSMHLERTGRLLAHAVEGETGAWPVFRGAVAGSAYPALIHYISLPVRLIAGDHPRAGAVTVAAWALLAILATFGIGHLLGGDRVGLLAAFFVAFSPGIYRFSRLETVDMPLTAMVTLTMFLLLRSDTLGNRASSLLFGAVAALGMLTKQSFLLYILLPCVYLMIQGVWASKGEGRTARLKNIGLATGIFATVVSIMFLLGSESWLATRQVVRTFYIGADQIGMVDNIKLLITHAFGPIMAALVLGGVLFVSKKDWANRTLFLWLASPLLILHIVFGMQSTRYLLPLIPAGAVFAALGLEKWLARTTKRRGVAQAMVAIMAVTIAFAHDNLRADQTPFTFREFERRQHIVGIPRPARVGWNVRPVVQKLAAEVVGKKVVMLLDSPYTSLVQGNLWIEDPRLDIDNLFERASAGRIPHELQPKNALRDYLAAADFILVKSGFNKDVRNYNYAQDVDPKFAQRVFKTFFAIKGEFELVNHFPYPETPSPILLYQKKETAAKLATPPDPAAPEPHIAPAPGT